MLLQILTYLLDVATGLLAGACLLRLYMQRQRVSFANPLGRLVLALSDWLVLPLRRVVPAAGRWDLASLAGALLLELAQHVLLALLLAGAMGLGAGLGWALVAAVFATARVAVMGLMGLVIVCAVLSWVPTRSPLGDVVVRLCEPLLAPVRRVVPLVGGVDLSPLVVLVLLQVLMIVLSHLQAGAML